MKALIKFLVVIVVLSGILSYRSACLVPPERALAQQLQGAAARDFLVEAGVLDHMTADLQSPRGRVFLDPQSRYPGYAREYARFGSSIALDGDAVLVGAPNGGPYRDGYAYVFTSAPENATQEVLMIPDGLGYTGAQFGFSVAIDGDTAVVGAPHMDVWMSEPGAAYIFKRIEGIESSQQASTWEFQQKLIPDYRASDILFGYSVALDGETVVVGSKGEPDGGAAYVYVNNGEIWDLQKKLIPDDGKRNDNFGWSVALEGDTAVIGAISAKPHGAVYVFTRNGSTWNESQKLHAGDAWERISFGYALALSEDTLIVGAPNADYNVEDMGAAFIFTRTGGRWQQEEFLVPHDGGDIKSRYHFGTCVALDGDTAVVGAHRAIGPPAVEGAVYVYIRGNTSWGIQQKLVPAHALLDRNVVRSVALDGDTLVFGDFTADVGDKLSAGMFYVAVRAPVPWLQDADFLAADRAPGDLFGISVDLDENTAVAGAPWADIGDNKDQGAAYVSTYVDSLWVNQQKLVAFDGQAGDNFGWSIALDGDTVVVGAHWAGVGNSDFQGAAYVFTHKYPIWVLQQKLVAADGQEGDGFGTAVAINDDTILVGAPGADSDYLLQDGAAYVYTRRDGLWSQQQKLTTGSNAANDFFGNAVALDGDTALIGADWAQANNNLDQGVAYIFTRSGTVWSEQAKLFVNYGNAGDHFGAAVALDGDTALIGAPDAIVDTYPDIRNGRVYVFERNDGKWDIMADFVVYTSQAGDSFGLSVALDGDTAVVGVPFADTGGNPNQGKAYVFARSGWRWSLQQKLLYARGAAQDRLGYAVALDGDLVIAGATRYFPGIAQPGRIFTFKRQKLAQEIDFPHPPSGQVGDRIELLAEATSGLPVTYRSVLPQTCTISLSTAELTAPGECRIIASQAGDATYAPATNGASIYVFGEARDSILYMPGIMRGE